MTIAVVYSALAAVGVLLAVAVVAVVAVQVVRHARRVDTGRYGEDAGAAVAEVASSGGDAVGVSDQAQPAVPAARTRSGGRAEA
jgi:hypothetical protein